MRGRDFTLLLGGAIVACAPEPRDSGRRFEEEPPAEPVATITLRAAPDTSAPGWRGLQLHVLIPVQSSDAVTRVTLQHVIDSVVAADKSLVFVRATAFRFGAIDPVTHEAPIDPILLAVWGPADTTVSGVRERKGVFRTNFLDVERADTATRRKR